MLFRSNDGEFGAKTALNVFSFGNLLEGLGGSFENLLEGLGGDGGVRGNHLPCCSSGGVGGNFFVLTSQIGGKISSFLARGAFSGTSGTSGGLAGSPGRGGRIPSGTVEVPFGQTGGDGGADISKDGQAGAPGYALISW